MASKAAREAYIARHPERVRESKRASTARYRDTHPDRVAKHQAARQDDSQICGGTMKIVPGTVTDPAFVAALEAEADARRGDVDDPELERLSAECDPGLAERRIVQYTQAPPRTLHHEVGAIADRVQAVFQNPGVEALGVVVTDALYSALGSLSFVADLAEEAGL